MVYTRPAHGDPFADASATDATVIIDALSDGVEALETTIALKANLASPTFTGTAAAPTPAVATDSTTLATTAFVGLRSRVTHPNTDDVLVQVWDVANARWQVTHYDSGWRTLTADNAFTPTYMRLRRQGSVVTLLIVAVNTFDDSKTSNVIQTLPSGFRPGASASSLIEFGHPRAANERCSVRDTGEVEFQAAVTQSLYLAMSWSTTDAVPASLPGSLFAAAPYA